MAAVIFVLLLKRTTKEPKTRLECYICVDIPTYNFLCMAISMVRTEMCFVSPSHPILCEDRTRTSGWGWAVSYGQRPAGAANIWQGWGQVLHSFAPPPANTNTALSSEDPHSWRGHRRFCGGNISSSFIFCEWRPQILNLITHFLQMSL